MNDDDDFDDDDYSTANRITKAADLPEWFDTEKYESAVHLDARGWEEQLDVRTLCYEEFWQNGPSAVEGTTDHLGFSLAELLAAIRETPIYPFYSSTFCDGYSRKICQLPYRPESSIAPGLSALTPEMIIRSVRLLPEEKQRELIDILSSKMEPFLIHSRPGLDWLSEPIEGVWHRIEVNKFLPKKLLLQSFEQYLARKEAGLIAEFKGRPHRSNLFLEWCNCGLLQYIDLTIWSEETNSDITNKALVHGIFPGNTEKGEDNIRTTTQKHAKSILHDRVVMHTLRGYASREEVLDSD